MQRDPALEEKILFELERKGRVVAAAKSLVIDGYNELQIQVHMRFLVDRGLVVAGSNSSGHITHFTLSSEGLAHLQALRKERPVQKIKTGSSDLLKLIGAAILGGIVTKLVEFIPWP